MLESFWPDGMGGFAGYTVTRKYFQQQSIADGVHVGLQHFQLMKHIFCFKFQYHFSFKERNS